MTASVARASAVALGLTAFAAACAEPSPQAPEVLDVQFANGGGPAPKVDATDPSSAPPGTTLDVRVLGRHFENGSAVTFLRDLVETGEIVTNSTSFVSDQELVANVTIQSDATEDLYDVQVSNKNKDGLGIELFTVGNCEGETDFSVDIQLRDAAGDKITSQGSSAYSDCEDGDLRIRDDGLLLWNVDVGRGFQLDFTDVIDGGDGLPSDQTVTRVGALRVLASEDNQDELTDHLLGMADGQSLPAMLRTRAEFGTSDTYQLRFQFPGSEAIDDGSSFLTITRNGSSGPCATVAEECWTIEARTTGLGPGAQDDWAMVFSKSGSGANTTLTDEGSFHMPFQWTVICPDCPPTSSSAPDDPPSVTVTNPAAGSTVSGTVSVTADASDDGSVTQVEFFVDGGSLGVDSDGSDGWSASWNTSGVADGDHTVSATATDDALQTATDQVTVTVDNSAPSTSTMHVGDLDGSSTNQGRTWTAVVDVRVLDASANPVTDATVSGSWSGGTSGSASCTTTSDGWCSVSESGIRKNHGSVTFAVDTVTHATLTYDATANADSDGDSDGTAITVPKP